MKYSVTLAFALGANWLLWSGHYHNAFLLTLGLLSCLFCVLVSRRMRIVDEEGAPAQLGLRPFTHYAPWLTKEVVIANLQVARVILSRDMPLQRTLVRVPMTPQSELGRVILANSLTLTPGTISVLMEGNEVLVHALSLEDAEADLEGEMGRRIRDMEHRP